MSIGLAPVTPELGRRRVRRLLIVIGLNLVVVVVQFGAGIVAHSVGLLADAGHNLADVAAVGLSLIAIRLTRRPPTASRSFGYHRSTVLAAEVNAAAVFVLSSLIAFGAVDRLVDPHRVRGGIVALVGLVALVVNAAAAALLYERGRSDLNMRSALLHMSGDALASVGVATAGLVIFLTGHLYWLDPAVSLAIAVLIAAQAVRLIIDAADVLLESTPAGLDLGALRQLMQSIDGVEDVHDLHAWSLSTEVRALSAHLVMTGHPTLEEAQAVADRVKAAIGGAYAIAHATLELECEACVDEAGDPCTMEDLVPLSAGHHGLHGHHHS